MSLYLSPYEGAGTRKNPFRPIGSDQAGWSAVDLRPDPTKVDGYALLHLPAPDARASLALIGESKEEALSISTRQQFSIKLLATLDSGWTLSEAIGQLLMFPPVNGWKPLRPTHKGVYEVWLDHQRWVALPAIAGGASDTFTRANESPVAAPWTKNGSGSNFALDSSALIKASGEDDATYYYDAAASSANQYSEVQLTVSVPFDGGPAVRIGSGATLNNYVVSAAGNYYKYVAGSFTDLGAHGDTWSTNDYVRLEASGSTLTLKRDTTTPATTTRDDVTDSSLSSGQPGLNAYAPYTAFDNWTGGDISGAISTHAAEKPIGRGLARGIGF